MTMRRALPLVLAAATGCSYFSKSPQPSGSEGAWAAERDKYTRECKVYNVLSDVAFATATYQAPSVRVARANRIADWKGMIPSERDALLSKEKAEEVESEEFLLSFYTEDHRANDLDTSRGTWRIVLIVNGNEQAPPLKVEAVRVDPTIQVLYPYVNPFYRLYRIRFPRYPGSTPLAELPFALQIAGALGKVELDWKPTPP
ncbi:MAG TPA: hypothetical protein VMT17_17965 [Anaeromyxobacteraceae bacterium]|nr:hypothetical protein [Anaeromyxobacteraceae bacterium]